MSNPAINWTVDQKLRPSEKFVLVALANYAHKVTNLAFLSHLKINKFTGHDRKTIIRALAKLQELNLISDTGKRIGKSGRVKIYRLNLEVNFNGQKGAMACAVQSSQIGTPTVPESLPNDPPFAGQESPKRDTEPLPNRSSTFKGTKREGSLSDVGNRVAHGVEYHLNDDDLEEIGRIAHGFDKYWLFRTYDAWTAGKGIIHNPRKAFFGWLEKFIRGKHASDY